MPVASVDFGHSFQIVPNDKYTVSRNNYTAAAAAAAQNNVPILCTIPKSDVMAVPIATYQLKKEIHFMPVVCVFCLVAKIDYSKYCLLLLC